MWLCDLAKAIAILRERGYNETVYEKIVPNSDGGIRFYTTYRTVDVVYPNGLILGFHLEEGEGSNVPA